MAPKYPDVASGLVRPWVAEDGKELITADGSTTVRDSCDITRVSGVGPKCEAVDGVL
jgi:hypothetical protein